MWVKIKRSGRIACGLLLLLLSVLLLGCSSASAQEQMYEISESELTQLEENLNELSTMNSEQREKLVNLQEKLKISEMSLEQSEKNSRMLGVKLDWLSREMTEQTASLENANRLLQEYEQEERRTKKRIENQRNFAYAVAAVMFVFCATK